MSEKKSYNVILLSMSTLNNAKNVVHYHWIEKEKEGEEQEKEYRFDGISQLEAGTKCIMTQLAAKGESVDRIVIMATSEAYKGKNNAVDFYKNRIVSFCKGEEKRESVMEIEEGDVNREWKEKAKKFIENEISKEDKRKEDKQKKDNQYDYDELRQVCNKAIKEFMSDEINGVGETQKACIASEHSKEDIQTNEILNKYKELAKKYELTGMAKNKKLRNLFKDKWICSVYSQLRYRYEILKQESKKRIEELENKIDTYVKQPKSNKKQDIEKFIRDYIYEYYCANSMYQVRAEKVQNIECGNIEKLFKVVKIDSNNTTTFWKVIGCIKSVRPSNDMSEINLYIDTQGGSRSYMTEANAIAELLKEQNIVLRGRYAVKFSPANMSNQIVEVSDNFKSYELITAMKVFKDYGRGDALVEYFDKYYSNDDVAKELTSIVKSASDAIQFCDINAFKDAVGKLAEKERIDKGNSKNNKRSQIAIVWQDIRKDYDVLIRTYKRETKELDYVALIEWCYNKKFYQQALTILEAKMPWQYFEDGLVDVYDYDEGKNKEYKVVRQLENHKVGYMYKLADLDYYAFTGLYKGTKRYVYNKDGDIKKSLEDYQNLKNMRNNMNHAGDKNSNSIVDDIGEYIDSYKILRRKEGRIEPCRHNEKAYLIGAVFKLSDEYICIAPLEYDKDINNNPTVAKLQDFKKFITDIQTIIDTNGTYGVQFQYNEKTVKEQYENFAKAIIDTHHNLENGTVKDEDRVLASAFYDGNVSIKEDNNVYVGEVLINSSAFRKKVFEPEFNGDGKIDENLREKEFAKAYYRWLHK